MDSTKDKIKEYAQRLYLEVNTEGNKVYSFRQIATKVLQKFHKETNFSTIQKWSQKYDWENTFIKLKQAGIEKGKEQLEEKENKLIDEKSQVIADIYKSNKQILSLAKNTLLSRLSGQPLKNFQGEEIEPKIQDANLIRLLEHAEDVLMNLHDKKSNDPDKLDYSHISTEELERRARAKMMLEDD